MKLTLKITLLFAIVLPQLCVTVQAQEKVTMMNGNIFFVNVQDTIGESIKMIDPESKKKDVVDIDRARIFSILYNNQTEIFIYKPDSLEDGNNLSREEMRSFIAGAHDANRRYKAPLAFWGSFGIGAGSGVFMPAWLSPIGAGLGAFLMGSNWIRINRSHVSDPKFLKDEFYIRGYESTARQARVQNVVKGAVVGLLLGATARYTLLEP